MVNTKLQNIDDLGVRIAVVETKIENISDYLEEHKESFKELASTVNDIKTDLTNLPHLVDAIKELSNDFSIITKKINAHESKLEVNKIYTKIVWGIIMLIITSGTGVLADWIINHK